MGSQSHSKNNSVHKYACFMCNKLPKKLPYEWDKIDNNFLLFGRTEQFLSDFRDFISEILAEISSEFARLAQYEDAISQKAQGDAALELVQTTLAIADLSTPQLDDFLVENFSRAKQLRVEIPVLNLVLQTIKNHLESIKSKTAETPSVPQNSEENNKRKGYERILEKFVKVLNTKNA